MFWSTGNVKYKCIFLVIFFLLFLSEKFKSDLFKILTPWLNPLINPLNHIWRIRHVKPKPPRLVNTQGRVLACTQTCVREQQDASHNGRKPVIDRDGEGGGRFTVMKPRFMPQKSKVIYKHKANYHERRGDQFCRIIFSY